MNKEQISKKIVATCFLAGMLEIYDFTIFGFLANNFNQNYFVFLSKEMSLVVTYAFFAIGFLFRPIGSLVFGYIGDNYGRKKALIVSISLMGIASLGIGLLPPYKIIGISSCFILLVLRIIQGISVGGEYTGALIFALESSSKNKAGLIGSMIICGCMSGLLLASFVKYILELTFMPSFAWRFAFLLGFMLTIIGFFIRKKFYETDEFSLMRNIKISKQRKSFLTQFRKLKLEIITTIFLAGTNGVNLYFITIYLPNHLKSKNFDAGNIQIIIIILMVALIPLFGYLSDRWHRGIQVILGMGLLTINGFILLPIIMHTDSKELIYLLLILFAVIMSLQSGATNTLAIEIFPSENRFTCSALSWSLGMGIIGGTMPMVASIIVDILDLNIIFISVYITLVSFISLIFVSLTLSKLCKEQDTLPKLSSLSTL